MIPKKLILSSGNNNYFYRTSNNIYFDQAQAIRTLERQKFYGCFGVFAAVPADAHNSNTSCFVFCCDNKDTIIHHYYYDTVSTP